MAGLIEKLHKIGDVINTVARVALGVTSIALCIAVIGQFILRWFGATMPLGNGVLLLYLRLDHDAWQCRSKPSSASYRC